MSTEDFGKYRIERRLAAGGMAELFVGFLQGAKGFERKVAIKRILPHLAADPAFQSMFWDEATLAANLNHPNIVQVLDFGEEAGQLFMALEFVDGVDLKSLSRGLSSQGRVLSAAELALIAEGVASGLHHVHTAASQAGDALNIIHRDISPHNVMVSRDGHIKVMDFGVAHAEVRASQTATGVLKGKLAYMAPEQANDQELDHRVDQFALGLLLWELAVGEAAYQGPNDAVLLRKVLSRDLESLQLYRSDLPEAFCSLVMRMLEARPQDRFDDMDAVYRAALQVRFGIGEQGAVATLAGLVPSAGPTASEAQPRRTTAASVENKPESTMSLTQKEHGAGSSQQFVATAALDVESLPTTASLQTAVTRFDDGGRNSHEDPTQLYSGARKVKNSSSPFLVGVVGTLVLALGVFLVNLLTQPSGESVQVELTPMIPPQNATAPTAASGAAPTLPEAKNSPATQAEPSKEGLERPAAIQPRPRSKPKVKPKPKPKARETASENPKRRGSGTLQLRVEEGWFNVMLGNRRLGTTPLGGVSLPAGEHLLILDNPVTGEQRKVNVEITDGGITRISVGAN